MSPPSLEVADIFRDHGAAWRRANAGHVSLGQIKVMSAIERCRTAALGGHVARCENEKCAHTVIAYNSCRNRHCPKCQGAAAREWLAEREAELLQVPYFHVVYTLPAAIADIAYQNKSVIYDLLFKASAETTLTIAADPKHLGARIGFMAVLHTWGSALTHHPHVHMVVPGGGLSPDGSTWIACRPRYFLTVEVLSALFRRLFLQMLVAAHDAGRLQFFGDHVPLADKAAFKAYLRPLRQIDWVVYAKEPFAGPKQVLRYLSRYTHRIAISNRRLLSADQKGVTFKYKDYRIEGPGRYKTMTLATDEFIRRFLIHVLPKGFHRIRHYGLLGNTNRAANIEHARKLLAMPSRPKEPETPKAAIDEPRVLPRPCPCCGGRMIVIETFARGCEPKHRPAPPPAAIRIDTSCCRHRRSTTAPILAIPAGSPPAANTLASVPCIGLYCHRKSRRATCRSLLHPAANILGLQQTDRRTCFCPPSSRPAPRLNPHSARRTAAELPTAISCLGAFPTPAARACGLVRDCRRPKTCTDSAARTCSKSGSGSGQ